MRARSLHLTPLLALLACYGCSADAEGGPSASTAGNGNALPTAGSGGLVGTAGSSPTAGSNATMANGGNAGNAAGGNSGLLTGNPGGTSNAGASNGGSTNNGGSANNAGSSGSSSGGSGDGPGIPCTEPFEAEFSDLKGCIADVSGITMKFFPLAPGKAVKRVAVFLHGDTAQDWQGWYPFLGDTVEWCLARDILVVAPLSPVAYDDDPPEDRSYGAAQGEDAEKVVKAIEDFLDAYKTPHHNLLYWTLSGGSWFVTSSFLPLMGARLPGIYALSCGASEFWYDYEWSIDGPARDQNKLLFNYGTEDFLKPGEEASAEKYETDGFSVTVKTYPGAEHCDHPIHEPTIEFWQSSL
jgi:hypothetical protein